MSAFTGSLTLTELTVHCRIWQLQEDFTYQVGDENSGRHIVVPKGFETDGASVPQLLWAVFPAWGTYSRAAIIHDWLCYNLWKGTPHPEGLTREAADLVFWEAMGVCGTGILVRWILYRGVRIGALQAKYDTKESLVDEANRLAWKA